MTEPLLTSEPLPRVTVLQRGEFATKDGAIYWVLSSCPLIGVGYWCDTHQEAFGHKQALSKHCAAGDHLVARWCPKHGFEAPPPKANPEAP